MMQCQARYVQVVDVKMVGFRCANKVPTKAHRRSGVEAHEDRPTRFRFYYNEKPHTREYWFCEECVARVEAQTDLVRWNPEGPNPLFLGEHV